MTSHVMVEVGRRSEQVPLHASGDSGGDSGGLRVQSPTGDSDFATGGKRRFGVGAVGAQRVAGAEAEHGGVY